MKRVLDLTLASIALVLFSPLLALVAVLVKINLGSPVLFRQKRPGQHGAIFEIMKFRTMLDHVDATGQPIADEFRLTRFGRFLRSTSLDELPELVNILRGDMSLVGPRPLLEDYLVLYDTRQATRHHVRPGLTGWAQVNGRNAISWDDKLELDAWYVENQSLMLDAKILYLTVRSVLKRNGIHAEGMATTTRFTGSAVVDRTERIFLSPPDVGTAERKALLRAFDSNWIAPVGPELSAFESELAEYTGVEACAALSSGTSALHLALLDAGVGPGDEVVVQSATFAATAFAVVYTGAKPVFCDSDFDTWGLDPELLEGFLKERASVDKLPAAVISVDLYGSCADYQRLLAICAEHGVPLIEDAAEALGSRVHDRSAGSFGRSAILSFNGNKIMTTSGGGALLGSGETIERARYLATQAKQPALHYEHTEVGFNYRMSNVLAALGRAQLAGLESKIERREQIHHMYRSQLPQLEWCPFAATTRPNYWLSVGLLPISHDPTAVCQALAAKNIEARPAWKPMHMQPVFAGCEMIGGDVSETLFAEGLCLPSGSSHSDETIQTVIDAVAEVLAQGPTA